jgi:RNA polymerase sigma-70 factor (ECF subfamily)
LHLQAATAGTTGSPPQGDEPIVRAAAAGDPTAWSRLYARFAPVIHGLLLLSMPRQDAEELTQDVFLRAMAKLHDLRNPAAIGAWLCQIARNEAATWARRKGRMDLRLTDLARQKPADVPSPQPSAPLDSETVLSQVRTLPEAYRETLVLRLVCGLTGPQIAAATGMTEGSVRVNLFRGMSLLREALGMEKQTGASKSGGSGGAA